MVASRPELVIFDLDGTAIESSPDARPSQRLVEAVALASEVGIATTVATSRPLAYCRDILHELGLQTPAVVAGGSMLYDAQDDKALDGLRMQAGAQQSLREALAMVPDACYVGNTDFSQTTRVAELPEGADFHALYFLSVPLLRAKRISYTAREISGVRSLYMRTMVCGELGFDVHIVPEDASKGSGVQKLQALGGYCMQATAVIGDGYNDLSMFEQAGTRLAIEGGDPDLLAQATQVLPGPSQDGVACYLESLALRGR